MQLSANPNFLGQPATDCQSLPFGDQLGYFIDTVFNYTTLAKCYKSPAFNGLGRLDRYRLG